MPDYNADRELGKGRLKWIVQSATRNLPKSIMTGRGELKLDDKGRCIIKDRALADEVRKKYARTMAVSRVFSDDPADQGHSYFFGQTPALPWKDEDPIRLEIEKGYADQANMTVEEFRKDWRVLKCYCKDPNCSGWKIVEVHDGRRSQEMVPVRSGG